MVSDIVAHRDGAKAIVWEHNTHIGDARATDMARAGMINVGQIVRERHLPDGVVLVGFGSHLAALLPGRSGVRQRHKCAHPS